MSASMSLLGNRVVRTEDPRFLRGDSQYVGDVGADDIAHVAFVRSTIPHANITNVELSEARAMPGILAIATGDDLGNLKLPSTVPLDESAHQRVLPVDRVRFVGEAVVAVVADTAAQAQDAAELVVIDYEQLPTLVTTDQSLVGDTLIHPGLESNIVAGFAPMPAEIDFTACEVAVSERVANQRMAPAPIEGRVGMADWSGDRLLFWASSQGAGAVKEAVKAAYDLDHDALRVITPDVGGGFGAKAGLHAEELALPGLSRLIGRPVQWAESRSENLVGMVHARAQDQHVRIGGTRSGRITHYALHVVQDAGAYGGVGAMLPTLTMMMTSGTYDIEHVQFSSESVVTTTTPVGAFRGAGRPEAAAAIERAVDLFATEIGMDPAEVRKINLLAPFSEPHANPMGTTYDVGNYPEALDLVLAASTYDELRAEQRRRRDAGDPVALGIGLSSYVEITAVGGPDGSSEYGTVELRDDGTVLGLSGSTPQGQGHATTWAMVIADELGIPMDQIELGFGDTDLIPATGITGGSRSAQIAGSAMLDASQKLVETAREHAAALLEANADDIVLDRDSGAFHVVGTPAVSVSWTDVAKAAPEPLIETADFVQPGSSFPFGAHCAVVEVDTETGAVTLTRHIAVDDCGTILNRLLVDGQVHGGLAAGAAQALMEEIRFDENGTPLTSNFADYGVISAAELPSFERVEMVTPTPLNPIGAKGIGESGTIGATPAVHNAVIDAVSHLGVTHIDMPCTPERVWQALAPSRS